MTQRDEPPAAVSATDPTVAERRIRAMQQRLEAALAPPQLEIINESHLHAGHAGARDGRGHFRLRIASANFAGLAPLTCHRMIYQALGDLMQTDIHALSIELIPASPQPGARPSP